VGEGGDGGIGRINPPTSILPRKGGRTKKDFHCIAWEKIMSHFAHQLNRIGNLLEKSLSAFVGVAIAGFAATVIVEVFFRYFLGFSLYWSNELATFLFVYLVFFGGSVALKRGELINVAFLKERLPLKWEKGVTLFMFFVMMAFALMASTFCTVLIQTSIKTKTVSPAMLIPMALIYLPIFLGFSFLAFFSLIGLINTLVHGRMKER
jgi:TRAP-type C4-dicarboxylate transport system permease small subunit